MGWGEWAGGRGLRKMAAVLEGETAQGADRACCLMPPPLSAWPGLGRGGLTCPHPSLSKNPGLQTPRKTFRNHREHCMPTRLLDRPQAG